MFSVDLMVFDSLVIIDLFSDINYSTLSSKPKLYFIDCCRGYNHLLKSKSFIPSEFSPMSNKCQYPDILIRTSTTPGHSLYADDLFGSLFVRVLCQTLDNFDLVEQFNICKLLIIVTKRISDFRNRVHPDKVVTREPGFLVLLRKLFRFKQSLTLPEKFNAKMVLTRISYGRTSDKFHKAHVLYWPNGVCIEKDIGNSIIADGGHDRILFFSKNGVYLRIIVERVSRPHGLTIWEDRLISSQ